MKLDNYLSTKFKWLSILALWAVVGLHSRTGRWSGVPDWTDALQDEVCKLFGFAVPIFLIISGFLFVSSYERHCWKELLKRKFWSLYLPACVWMVICEVLTIPVNVYLHESLNLSVLPFAFLLNYEKFGICFHFWYVRALILFFICAPLIYWLTATVRRAWISFALVTIVLLNLTKFFPAIPSRIAIGPYCMQYFWSAIPLFFLGGCVARTPRMNDRWRLPFILIALMVAFLTWGSPSREFAFNMSLVSVIWLAYDVIAQKVDIPKPPVALTCTFFVYCMHTIVIKYVSGCGRVLMGPSPVAKLTGFLFNCMSFWLCVLIANGVRKILPRSYQLLSGGRN